MKNKLEIARQTINEVDRKMIELFKERMTAVKTVALYKKENNLEILDKNRENLVIEKNKQLLNDESLLDYYLEFLDTILKVSKQYQRDINEK